MARRHARQGPALPAAAGAHVPVLRVPSRHVHLRRAHHARHAAVRLERQERMVLEVHLPLHVPRGRHLSVADRVPRVRPLHPSAAPVHTEGRSAETQEDRLHGPRRRMLRRHLRVPEPAHRERQLPGHVPHAAHGGPRTRGRP